MMDLVILSSSPTRRSRSHYSLPSSSPPLPAATDVLRRKPTTVLRGGLRTGINPDSGLRGFTSTLSLLQDNQIPFDDQSDEDNLPPPSAQPQRFLSPDLELVEEPELTKKPRKRQVKKAAETENGEPSTRRKRTKAQDDKENKPEPKKRKPRAKAVDKELLQDDSTSIDVSVGGAPKKRKSRAKASDKKALQEPDSIPAVASNGNQDIATVNTDGSVKDVEELGLDRALRRRTDWTPPKNTSKPVVSGAVVGVRLEADILIAVNALKDRSEGPPAASQIVTTSSPAAAPKFGDLVGNFALAASSTAISNVAIPRLPSGEPLTKRSRIEFIDMPHAGVHSVSEPPPQTKKPKKKARTITEIATMGYKLPEEIGPALNEPLPAVLQLVDTPQVAPQPRNPSPAKRTRQPRKKTGDPKAPPKRAGKGSKSAGAAKKNGDSMETDLLSPGTAANKIHEQDLLFGTSSQLLRGDSPDFIRQLQRSIQESDVLNVYAAEPSPVIKSTTPGLLATIKASRGLWSAAARDLDDGMLDAEPRQRKVNRAPKAQISADGDKLFNAIEDVERSVHRAASPLPRARSRGQMVQRQDPEGFVDIDQVEGVDSIPLPATSNAPALRFEDIEDVEKSVAKSLPPPDRTALQALPSNVHLSRLETTGKRSGKNHIKDADKVVKVKTARKPSAKAVAKETAKKTTKKVTEPEAVKPSVEARASTPLARITTPKSLRKKDWSKIEEIEDSEEEPLSSSPVHAAPTNPLQLSPSRAQAATATNTQPAQVVATKESTVSATIKPAKAKYAPGKHDWTESLAGLFPLITQAVKAAPPTRDPSHPSWQEKILLYDPIVLEDFTAWLNEQGVTALGKKDDMEEIQDWMVQRWCENNGVCCFFKNSTRNGIKA